LKSVIVSLVPEKTEKVIHKLSTSYPQVIHRVIHRLKYRWHSKKTLKSAVQKLHVYYY